MRDIRHFSTKKLSHRTEEALLCAGAALAGFCNGLLGSGGGMFLWFALGKFGKCRKKEIFATTSAVILFFSAVSAAVYFASGQIGKEALSWYLAPALLGGVFGAFLLGKLKTGFVRNLFALLLLFSGAVLVIR